MKVLQQCLEEAPEHGSQDTSKSSHELPMEPQAKVELSLGKHHVHTQCPKDPTSNHRTSSRLVRYATFASAPMRFTLSHLHLLKPSLFHDKLGVPMEAILDTCG